MNRRSARLAFVVCASAGTAPDGTIASARAEADRAGLPVEVVLVRTDATAGDEAPADLTVDAHPLDSAYLRNRGLEATGAPIVAFVDASLEVEHGWAGALASAFDRNPSPAAVRGRGNVAFERSALVTIGGFDRRFGGPGTEWGLEIEDALLRLSAAGRSIGRETARAALPGLGRPSTRRVIDPVLVARFARRHRAIVPILPHLAGTAWSLATTRRGQAALRGRDHGDLAVAALLARCPEGLRTALSGVALEPSGASFRSKTHIRFSVGGTRVLHVYVNPTARLRRALAEREAIRAGARLEGIPRLHQVAEGFDSLWVIEDAVPGRLPRAEDVREWFPAVADWAVALAGVPRRSLDDSYEWRAHRQEALEVARQSRLGDVTDAAFEVVSALPSRHMHGDFQPRNILIDGDRIGLVDWEGAWAEGIPGLDLVFLTLLARGDAPDASLLLPLAHGIDPDWAPVTPRLERLGLDRHRVRPALIVMLATWAVAERRRLRRLGAPPREPVWEPMFRRLVPALAAG